MAGPSLGAPAPFPSTTLQASRTRRVHGIFPLGEARFIVASSRQRQHADALGVIIGAGNFGSAECLVTARCSPHQARVIAQALLSAAADAERGAA